MSTEVKIILTSGAVGMVAGGFVGDYLGSLSDTALAGWGNPNGLLEFLGATTGVPLGGFAGLFISTLLLNIASGIRWNRR